MEHYQCHCCHVTTTNSECISDTVEFFPHTKAVDPLTSHDAAILAAEALTEALKKRKPPADLAPLIDPAKSTLSRLQQFIHPTPNVEATVSKPPRVQAPPRVQPTVDANEPIAKRTQNGGSTFEPINFYANAVTHPITGKQMEYRQLIKDPITRDAWQLSAANEFGRLAQGVSRRVKGTNTINHLYPTP
jgi:hypothetical protein